MDTICASWKLYRDKSTPASLYVAGWVQAKTELYDEQKVISRKKISVKVPATTIKDDTILQEVGIFWKRYFIRYLGVLWIIVSTRIITFLSISWRECVAVAIGGEQMGSSKVNTKLVTKTETLGRVSKSDSSGEYALVISSACFGLRVLAMLKVWWQECDPEKRLTLS